MRRHAQVAAAGPTRRYAAALRAGRSDGRILLPAGVLTALLFTVLLASSAAPASAADCANEAIRAEQGEAALALPDCRAYEMVSPLGSSPVKDNKGNVASLSGDRVAYRSWNPFPGQENEALRYVSERGAGGWKTYNPIPGQNASQTSSFFACSPSFAVTPELDHLLLVDGYHNVGIRPDEELPVEGEECFGDEPALDPGEPRGYMNIFSTDPAGSFYRLMNQTPAGVQPRNAELLGYNADGSVAVFAEWAKLTPDAPEPEYVQYADNGENIYASRNGTMRYVPYLPDGTPVRAYLANGGKRGGGRTNIANATHVISDDGERIFFEYETKLYLREHAMREQSATVGDQCTEPEKACTIAIDVSEEGPSENGFYGQRARFNRSFVYATPDGSRVFFVDDRKLTPDANTALPVKNAYGELVNGKADLYEYDVGSGETTDLTPNPGGEPANVRGLSGAAEDASYIYFVAFGNLTGGQRNSNGDSAQAGHNNLYVLHDGGITYVTTMTGGESEPTGGEAGNWQESSSDSHADESVRNQNTGGLTSRFSRNGRFLAFASAGQLTEFDNTPAEPADCAGGAFGTVPGSGCLELYLYDAEAGQLECASCSPSGAAPTGQTRLEGPAEALEPYGPGPNYLLHAVSNDGRLFFDTPNSLAPGDVNTSLDVYEYEGGSPHLISTGGPGGAAEFVDASADGRDVFFSGGQALVGRDTDGSNSLYDARAGGGFTEPPPLPGCEGEACRGAASGAPASGAAGTASFQGPGNKVQKHKRDCSRFTKQAQKLSKQAKSLNRRAAKASGKRAAKLSGEARKKAKKAKKASKKSKTCKRENRGAGK